MSAILVSGQEPDPLKVVGTSSGIPEQYGADFLIPGIGFMLGVQRKGFPGDFMSSLDDGRLHTSLVKLTKCEKRVLILEGTPKWTTSGFLVHDYVQFSRSQLRNLLMSAHEELGIHTMWTDGIQDTIDTLRDLARWAAKGTHNSLFDRPNMKSPFKRKFSEKDKAMFLLQGFDGIGPELAGRIYDHFKRVPLRWDDDGELINVKGVGKGKMKSLKEIVK